MKFIGGNTKNNETQTRKTRTPKQVQGSKTYTASPLKDHLINHGIT